MKSGCARGTSLLNIYAVSRPTEIDLFAVASGGQHTWACSIFNLGKPRPRVSFTDAQI